MKTFHTILKVVLVALLAMPIFGALGIFPKPTADMYNTVQAFDFITLMYTAKYITAVMAIVFASAIYLILTKRTAFAMLLIMPIAINIIGFHAFLDGGLLTSGALMGNVFFLIVCYFLYHHRARYLSLLQKDQ